MSLQSDDEDIPLSHAEACREPHLAPGKSLSVEHLQRLFRRGKKGRDGTMKKLGTVLTGRGEHTTLRLIKQFVAELNQPAAPAIGDAAALPVLSHEAAERHLDAIGVK